MDVSLSRIFDNALDGTKEIAETTQEKTIEFHEKFISKVIPDFGKYGEAATFAAEMVPGVSEYNAIRNGDWLGFAVSAGIDITAFAAGAFSLGAGYAAVKGGGVAAKTGLKVALKEVSEKGFKSVIKETVEQGSKYFVKETVEESTEKFTKKVAKEIGDKMDKSLIPKYLDEIQNITKIEISPQQLDKLKHALKEQDFFRLDPEKIKTNRKLFDNARDKLIKEWEEKTGKVWPTYAEDVLDEAGEIIKRAGQRFDAHHIVELKWGGPNAWWNLIPADIDAHKLIHAKGSLADLIF